MFVSSFSQIFLFYLIFSLILFICECAQCSTQTIKTKHPIGVSNLRIRVYGNRLRRRQSNPFPLSPTKRSILQCAKSVDIISVPNEWTSFAGVGLSGVVTLVETTHALTNASEIAQVAAPACTGIFVSHTKILTSAHCVYHQRQVGDDSSRWLFGSSGNTSRYLYAIASRVDISDDTYTVYDLNRACIPTSYITAPNEATTSAQQNDFALLETNGRFVGLPNGMATIAQNISLEIEKDYMLLQYPSDVGAGKRLVIDQTTSAIHRWKLNQGWFHTIDLASWSGSSGGPIVDVEESNKKGRLVIVGVLMSSGIGICDSGIVPIAGNPLVQNVWLQSEREKGRVGNREIEQDDVMESAEMELEDESELNSSPEEQLSLLLTDVLNAQIEPSPDFNW